MKYMLLVTMLLLPLSLVNCANAKDLAKVAKPNNETIHDEPNSDSLGKRIRARVTYYCPERIFGTHVAQPKIAKATDGITVAAHPDFKFGTRIKIPELSTAKMLVQDRGPAVTKKLASRGKTYVFDVFCSSRAEMKRLARTMPEYMDIIVN